MCVRACVCVRQCVSVSACQWKRDGEGGMGEERIQRINTLSGSLCIHSIPISMMRRNSKIRSKHQYFKVIKRKDLVLITVHLHRMSAAHSDNTGSLQATIERNPPHAPHSGWPFRASFCALWVIRFPRVKFYEDPTKSVWDEITTEVPCIYTCKKITFAC